MNDSFFPPRRRRESLELQLTALIDVFSMIVIFLIFGTVFGAADMTIPKELQLPKSYSKEGIDSAPQVILQKGQVKFSIGNQTLPLADFKSEEGRKHVQETLKASAQAFQDKRKGSAGGNITAINLVADQTAVYEDIFDVISVFRRLGFDSIFFVASGEVKKK